MAWVGNLVRILMKMGMMLLLRSRSLQDLSDEMKEEERNIPRAAIEVRREVA